MSSQGTLIEENPHNIMSMNESMQRMKKFQNRAKAWAKYKREHPETSEHPELRSINVGKIKTVNIDKVVEEIKQHPGNAYFKKTKLPYLENTLTPPPPASNQNFTPIKAWGHKHMRNILPPIYTRKHARLHNILPQVAGLPAALKKKRSRKGKKTRSHRKSMRKLLKC